MEISSASKMVIFTNKRCLICWEGEDELNLGDLHDLQVFSVHYLCLLTGVNAYPSTSNKGLLGFLLGDIYSVYKMYMNIICEYCRRSGASLECCLCKKRYHLPCGVKNGARIEMLGSYPSYCGDCAYEIFPKSDNLKKFPCAICYSSSQKDDILFWPKCCKPEQMIHFDCLKLYAVIAGYLMRCPLCMDRHKFRRSTRKFGVYIPNSDADWLNAKPDKFISYPLRCCAKICVMNPYNEMSTALTPCLICEQKVAHVECTFSGIYLCMGCTKDVWPDTDCSEINKIGNFSESFPWFFKLMETIKYGKSLQGPLNQILKLLGTNITNHETINWHNCLDAKNTNLIATKLIECYGDAMSKYYYIGGPNPKKVKR